MRSGRCQTERPRHKHDDQKVHGIDGFRIQQAHLGRLGAGRCQSQWQPGADDARVCRPERGRQQEPAERFPLVPAPRPQRVQRLVQIAGYRQCVVFRGVEPANDEPAGDNGQEGDGQEGQEPLTPQHPDTRLLRDDALGQNARLLLMNILLKMVLV